MFGVSGRFRDYFTFAKPLEIYQVEIFSCVKIAKCMEYKVPKYLQRFFQIIIFQIKPIGPNEILNIYMCVETGISVSSAKSLG